MKDLKNSRSVYCTESELRRLKQFLQIIRIYDHMPLLFLHHKVDVSLFIRILSGESFRKSENFEESLKHDQVYFVLLFSATRFIYCVYRTGSYSQYG